jgi:hypothetical protein
MTLYDTGGRCELVLRRPMGLEGMYWLERSVLTSRGVAQLVYVCMMEGIIAYLDGVSAKEYLGDIELSVLGTPRVQGIQCVAGLLPEGGFLALPERWI